jgi:hypothetical protein
MIALKAMTFLTKPMVYRCNNDATELYETHKIDWAHQKSAINLHSSACHVEEAETTNVAAAHH